MAFQAPWKARPLGSYSSENTFCVAHPCFRPGGRVFFPDALWNPWGCMLELSVSGCVCVGGGRLRIRDDDANPAWSDIFFWNSERFPYVFAFSWLCQLDNLIQISPNPRGVCISQPDTLARLGFNYPVPSDCSHPKEITAAEALKGNIWWIESAKPVKCDRNWHADSDSGNPWKLPQVNLRTWQRTLTTKHTTLPQECLFKYFCLWFVSSHNRSPNHRSISFMRFKWTLVDSHGPIIRLMSESPLRHVCKQAC